MVPSPLLMESVPLIGEEETEGNELGDITFEKPQPSPYCTTLAKHLSTSHISSVLSALFTLFSSLLQFLIPSFLSPYHNQEYHTYSPSSTNWLDGLRGLSALSVVIYHYLAAYTTSLIYIYHPTTHPNPLLLPFIRLIYNGSASVRVFFVISGFALTYKPVGLLNQSGGKGYDRFSKTLASSALRRWARLMLPCMGIYVLIHGVRIMNGLDWVVRHHEANAKDLPGGLEPIPEKSSEGVLGQVGVMMREFWGFAVREAVLGEKRENKTDNHLWTVPVEFQQSMFIFLFLLAISRVRRRVRVYIISPAICLLYISFKKFNTPLFISGYIFAEIHASIHHPRQQQLLLPCSSSLPASPCSSSALKSSLAKISRKFLIIALFVTSLHFLSYPRTDGHISPFYTPLTNLIIRNLGYSTYETRVAIHTYGAIFLVFSLLWLEGVRRVLMLRVCQYLGRISFSLYLVHGLVLRTLSHRVVLGLWDVVNKRWAEEEGREEMRTGVVVGAFFVVVMPVTIWIGDLFWRGVEMRAVRFVKWVEKKMVDKYKDEGNDVNENVR